MSQAAYALATPETQKEQAPVGELSELELEMIGGGMPTVNGI